MNEVTPFIGILVLCSVCFWLGYATRYYKQKSKLTIYVNTDGKIHGYLIETPDEIEIKKGEL